MPTTPRSKAAKAKRVTAQRRKGNNGSKVRTSTALAHRPKVQTLAASDLSAEDREFALVYITNGFRAGPAYLSVHPEVTVESSRVMGCRLLTRVKVKAFISSQLEDRWKAIHMTGDEVLARVALDARADLRALVGENGKLLKLEDWSDDFANSAESIEFNEDGTVKKVKLASRTAARRTILEITGKVKGAGEGLDALAAAIREDAERRKRGE